MSKTKALIANINGEDVKQLQAMISDLETGYMANHSVAADKRRFKYESFLRTLLDRVCVDDPSGAGKGGE